MKMLVWRYETLKGRQPDNIATIVPANAKFVKLIR